jgi:glycerophosphoryl diester phosphodiesterase
MYDGRTLVFGHRGASAYAPMNTIPAFELAAAQGADGVELDVHRSKDGHAVIVHDFTVDKTTNGTGTVKEMTLAQLKALDAGAWKSLEYAGVRVPTLGEVFEAVGQRLYINVEIKSNTLRTDGVEQVVADVIRQYDMEKRVVVSSFNPLALRRFHNCMAEVPLGYLTAPDMPVITRLFAVNMQYDALHPFHETIDAAYMESARQRGLRVNTWTVNEPARAVELRDLGVDLLVTDQPDVIRDALAD